MACIEDWVYNQLKDLDVTFTPNYQNKTDFIFLTEGPVMTAMGNNSSAVFCHGCFVTEKFSKGALVDAILAQNQPKFLIFMDDRKSHVLDVVKVCEAHNIPCLGIVFRGVDLLPGAPDPQIAEIQKNELTQNVHWLEDEEAEKIFKNSAK